MPLTLTSLGCIYNPDTPLAHEALIDVSLAIEPGHVMLISGTTGSGKSTLLRCAAGLLTPTVGTVSIDGKAVKAGDVGFVFQRPEAQFFAATVLEDVVFGPRNRGRNIAQAEEDARKALECVGMDPEIYGTRSPFTLSGGQARRVAIAGVLAMQPRYLLFDEPTAGLDAEGRDFILGLIASLAREGVGIVVVTHDLDTFLDAFDVAVLLRKGRAIWQGVASALLGDPVLFERAGLEIPGILAFQQTLGAQPGYLSTDPGEVASWALRGYPLPGLALRDHVSVPGNHASGHDGSDVVGGRP
jgi:energy-coupling factor transporter ATP-binding protein EcfA2